MNIPKTIFIILLNLSFNQNSLNVDLLFNYDYDFGVNDIWGYETNDNREFAIVGTESGTSIIEILDNTTIERGFIEGGPSTWRDIKSYGEYIYIGTENSNGGVQIVSIQSEVGVDSGDLDEAGAAELFGSTDGFKAQEPNVVPSFEDAAPSSVEEDDF